MNSMTMLCGNFHNPTDDRRHMPVYDRTKISGVLDGNALVGANVDGTIVLSAVLKQPGGLPIIVDRYYGHGTHAAACAVADAARMTHGTRVRAVGYQLALNWALPMLALELQACTGLEPITTIEVHQ